MTRTSWRTSSVTNRLALVLATWFGCGYFPIGSGTVGSAAAIGIWWALAAGLGWGWPHLAAAAGLSTVAGIWASDVVARSTGRNDPSIVVIDEVAGQWLTLLGASVWDWRTLIGAFALFRILDIWKPPPIRQMERVKGGAGIVLDDVAAGIIGAALLWAVTQWWSS